MKVPRSWLNRHCIVRVLLLQTLCIRLCSLCVKAILAFYQWSLVTQPRPRPRMSQSRLAVQGVALEGQARFGSQQSEDLVEKIPKVIYLQHLELSWSKHPNAAFGQYYEVDSSST